MTAPPLAIRSTGMVCGVGLNAPAACAAIRCGINSFQETRFMDRGGEWIQGSTVSLAQPWRGRAKLVKMLTMAVGECLAQEPGLAPEMLPLLLCVAEPERPGRLDGIDTELFSEMEAELGVRFHEQSAIIAHGRVGGAVALRQARRLVHETDIENVILAGVDSLLVGPTLSAYEERERLLTSQNSNGFIPGEAAAAVIVSKPRSGDKPELLCLGLGFAREQATVETERPLRAEGLSTAIKAALAEADCTLGAADFRITDLSGEQYYFKEAALALSRTLRQRKEFYDIWHPADCIGEVGAAIGPVMLGSLLAAQRKAYAQGSNVLCHSGSDDGKRAALILAFRPASAS